MSTSNSAGATLAERSLPAGGWPTEPTAAWGLTPRPRRTCARAEQPVVLLRLVHGAGAAPEADGRLRELYLTMQPERLRTVRDPMRSHDARDRLKSRPRSC